jgi:hypothetical protein
VISITAAERVGDCALKISFSDGAVRQVDFGQFLLSSANPQIRSYLDPARFANFRIVEGDLIWDDYGL